MMEDDEGCNKNGGKIACFFQRTTWDYSTHCLVLNVCYDTRMEQFMNSKYCNFVFS